MTERMTLSSETALREEREADTRLFAPLLGIALFGHLAAYVAWYDDLGPLASNFVFPAGVIAALKLGTRGALYALAWALLSNALLGVVLETSSGWAAGFTHAVLDVNYLVSHAALAFALLILGRQRDLKGRLEQQMEELSRTQAALREAERMREEARLTQRLTRTERMASVGTLAAGVAHEVNNPLTYVIGNLYYALEELDRDGVDEKLRKELSELLRDALDGAERVRRIVRDLKTFSRATDDRSEQYIDVNTSIEAAVNLLKNEIRHRARLSLELFPALPRVVGSESRLVQALVNLLMNAAQAISEGNAGDELITVRSSLSGDGRVRIEIRDSGAGMSEEVRQRIFDPFFTTKPLGVGTGLGLSVANGIVQAMSGELSVESSVGQGSSFTVLLPAEPSALVPPARKRSSAPPRGTRLRVLVVDDEPKVGVSLRRMLREWDVSVTQDGRDALELLRRDRSFDAVLCDLMMPHVTGMDLYAEIRALDPALARRFVFMTGGAFTARAQAFVDDVPNTTLDKPFEKHDVLSAVERTLREVSAGREGAGSTT